MIRIYLTGAMVLGAIAAFPATAEASTWVTGPACEPGFYVNPDDLAGGCLPPTPGNSYVALSISPSSGGGGWGMADSEEEAARIAIAQCVANSNSVCEV